MRPCVRAAGRAAPVPGPGSGAGRSRQTNLHQDVGPGGRGDSRTLSLIPNPKEESP